MLLLLLLITEISALLPGDWSRFTHGLNTFRRIRAVELKASNLQKVYWDENLEQIARRLVINPTRLRKYSDNSSVYWMETTEINSEKQLNLFFSQLTQSGAHNEDRVTERTWNRPYNLAIFHYVIRIGCSQDVRVERRIKVTTLLCVFGPSPVLHDSRLFSRGPVCSECPLDTGCDNNLCDERTPAGLPSLIDILGIRMSKSWQIFTGTLLGVMALAIMVFVILLYLQS